MRLLARERGVGDPQRPPTITLREIIGWAQNHRARTGRWPQAGTGRIVGGPGITWSAVNDALRNGRRGFPGGSSLATVLARYRKA